MWRCGMTENKIIERRLKKKNVFKLITENGNQMLCNAKTVSKKCILSKFEFFKDY